MRTGKLFEYSTPDEMGDAKRKFAKSWKTIYLD